jgi:hypothetical protein
MRDDFSPHLKDGCTMTPEQRLDRLERVAKLMATAGLRARKEWRDQAREQNEKINILISMHHQNEDASRAESHALNEKISILVDSQIKTDDQIKAHDKDLAELRASQKLTDQALRAFLDSLRKGRNGKSSD